MLKRTWIPLLGGCLVASALVVLSGCKRPSDADEEGGIGNEPASERYPDAERPVTVFPEQFKTDDVTVNEFIRKALDHCQRGDYDRFRQLFGVAYEPPDEARFDRVWKGVKQIQIAGVIEDARLKPPEYYIHVVIQLRKADRYDRTERQAVVRVYREGDEWQMAPAPSEIQSEVLAASTQPTSGPATTRPSRRHPASRPTTSAASRPR